MFCNFKSPAAKRYQRGIFMTMTGYTLALLGVTFYFNRHHPQGAEAYLLAMLPAIPIVCMLAVVGIYLRDEKDEFQRWMMIKAMLWATGVILATATVVGFLENFVEFKAPAAYFIFVLYWIVFGFARGVLQWQSRRSDD